MRDVLCLLPLFLVLGCNGGEIDDTGEDTDTDTEVTLPPATGDLTCYTGGDAWLTQTPDPSLAVVGAGTGQVIDFESDNDVIEAKVQVWHDDDVTQAPDATATSDQNGAVTLELAACQPIAYKVSTPPELDETKDTFEAHQIIEPAVEDGLIVTDFTSVSSVTFQIIPSLLGISVDPEKSIIAGTAYDCNDEPIEGARIVVKDATGSTPQGSVVKYFIENFPNRDQLYTSPDGLWVVVNVPPGEVTVEMWAVQGSGDPLLLGATVLQSYADSINISNIYTGFASGVKYPDSCLLAE